MTGFNLGDYVTVAERLTAAHARWPDLRIQTSAPKVIELRDHVFLEVTATIYRSPDDPLPAIATAWEPWPGKTPYTRDSEAMNAETSAIGRALGAMSPPAKSLASREEVRNRVADDGPEGPFPESVSRCTPSGSGNPITSKQADLIRLMSAERGLTAADDLDGWTTTQGTDEIARLKTIPRVK